jgi:hypothetical protein
MIKRLFEILSNKWIVIITLVTTICLFIILGRIDAAVAGSEGMGVIYLQMAFLKSYFVGVIATWGVEGVNLFLGTIWLDFIFPVSYGILFASLYATITSDDESFSIDSIASIDKISFLLPLCAASFDYLENISHIVILVFRLYYNPMTIMASTFAFLKWLLLLLSILMIARKYIASKR